MIELGVKQKLYIDHKTDLCFTSEKAGSTECKDW